MLTGISLWNRAKKETRSTSPFQFQRPTVEQLEDRLLPSLSLQLTNLVTDSSPPKLASQQYWPATLLGDFNGDGRKDIVGFDTDGMWWTGLAEETTLQGSMWSQWTPSINWASVQVGDF